MRAHARWALVAAAGLVIGDMTAAVPREIRDPQGHLVLTVLEDGTTVSYSYDAQGNLVSSQRSDGSRLEKGPAAQTSAPSGQRTGQ